jgi:hypothetical protein
LKRIFSLGDIIMDGRITVEMIFRRVYGDVDSTKLGQDMQWAIIKTALTFLFHKCREGLQLISDSHVS